MSITITNNSSTPKNEPVAMSDLAKPEVENEESAPAEKADEKLEATDTSDGTDADDAKDGEAKPKKLSGFQRRINKKNAQLSEKEREVAFWKSEAMKRREPEQASAKPEKPDSKDGRPNPDKFETHEAYVEAVTDWKVEQKLSERDQKEKQAKVKTEFDQRVSGHMKEVEKFKKDNPDFDELMDEVDDVPMSLAMQEVLMGRPALMYELTKNRDEFERINSLPALELAMEIGRFQSKLSKAETQEIKTSKAPEPIKPVGSKSAGSARLSIYDSDISQQDYERLRREQMKKKSAWG